MTRQTTVNPTTPRKRSARYQAKLCLLVLALPTLFACSAPRDTVDITFVPVWQDRRLDCIESDKSLSDLRFFVSNVQLIDSNGGVHPVELTPDERWQQAAIALVDLETGDGTCQNGTGTSNAHVRGTVEAIKPVALQFTLGVPFELNHANPLLAMAPLNDAAMHWHWRSGYKFMRAGVTTRNDGTWLHLGSTACEGTVRNITACSSPNRVVIELEDFRSTSGRVAVDLATLFRGTDLQDGVRSDCSSGPAETECGPMFAALGLPFDGVDSDISHVFRLLP